MYLCFSHICACKLDVQKTNIRITQFYHIRNSIVGCWVANRRFLPALDLWDVAIDVLRSTQDDAISNVANSQETGARPM